MRPEQRDHIRRQTQRFVNRTRNVGFDLFRVAEVANFRRNDQPLGAGPLIGCAKRDDTAGAHAFHTSRNFLDFVWVQVASGFDDDVLRAARQVKFAFAPIRQIAGIEPISITHQFAGRLGIAIIAARRRGAPEPQLPFLAFAQIAPSRIHDAHFDRGQRLAGIHEFQWRGVAGACRNGAAFGFERCTLDAVHLVTVAKARHRNRQRSFRQPVDCHQRLGIEPIGREAFRKPLQCLGTHGFRAVRRSAPRSQIEPFQIFIRDFAHTQFISKIRRGRDRRAMLLNRAQPAFRPAEKRQRRHHDQRNTDKQRHEPRADQSHVVV